MKDLVFFPIRFIFNHKTVKRLGLTPLQEERFKVCLPYTKGKEKVLDIGCGKGNAFIKYIGRGVGLDPGFPEADVMAKAENMPFKNKEFQVVTMMGTWRYIKSEQRDKTMQEIHRVLADDGLLLILESHQTLTRIRHKLAWWNPYLGMEEKSISKKEIKDLIKRNNFKLIKIVRFIYGLSAMYVAGKKC